jgi:hypothetical protein
MTPQPESHQQQKRGGIRAKKQGRLEQSRAIESIKDGSPDKYSGFLGVVFLGVVF